MMKVYARTREREQAWKMGAFCLGGALIAAPALTFIPFLRDADHRHPADVSFLTML